MSNLSDSTTTESSFTSFNIPEIADLTSEDNIDLRSIGDRKTALFVIIPAADDTYNFLVSMMYSQLFETLYYRAENECPYERWIKYDQDVLAIVPKNKKGDEYIFASENLSIL